MDRYEEALERAKAGKPMDEVFPELKESEDERMRKTLVQLVEDAWAGRETAEVSDERVYHACLAYLEKQKENYLGKYSEEGNLAYRLNWVMQDYYKAGKDDEEREHRFKCYKLFWGALEDADFFEQKEQKPAGWNEEDENMLNSIIATCKLAQEDRDSSPARSLYKKQETFLKSLRPSWKPSEEQMEALLRAVDDLQGKPYWGYINEVVYDIRDKLM